MAKKQPKEFIVAEGIISLVAGFYLITENLTAGWKIFGFVLIALGLGLILSNFK